MGLINRDKQDHLKVSPQILVFLTLKIVLIFDHWLLIFDNF